MDTGKAFIVFEYAHQNGVWTVASEETKYQGLYHLTIYNGVNKSIVPWLLEGIQVKNTIYKLNKIPADAIKSYDLFTTSVAGAASMSIKYGR